MIGWRSHHWGLSDSSRFSEMYSSTSNGSCGKLLVLQKKFNQTYALVPAVLNAMDNMNNLAFNTVWLPVGLFPADCPHHFLSFFVFSWLSMCLVSHPPFFPWSNPRIQKFELAPSGFKVCLDANNYECRKLGLFWQILPMFSHKSRDKRCRMCIKKTHGPGTST